jgi:hypothetical protein
MLETEIMSNKLYALLLAVAFAAPTAVLAQDDTGAVTDEVPADPILLTEEAIILGTVATVGLALAIGEGDSTVSTPSTP